MKISEKTFAILLALSFILCVRAEDDPIQAFIKANQPGPQHKLLEQLVGTWDVSSKEWTSPGAAPLQVKGTAEVVMLYNGRLLHSKGKFQLPGLPPAENMLFLGYDNLKKQYVSTGFASLDTSMNISYGNVDATGKVFSFQYRYQDPAGRTVDGRSVLTIEDPDRVTFDAYEKAPDGKERKVSESVYVRAKAGTSESSRNITEDEAIKEAIARETKAFYDNDLEKLKAAWLHRDDVVRINVGRDGSTMYKGWQEVDRWYTQILARMPETRLVRYETSNWVIQTSGNLAWAEYDQLLTASQIGQEWSDRSHEIRTLAKEDGQWKFVALLDVPSTILTSETQADPMQEWIKANQAGAEHKILEQLEGKWELVTSDFRVPKGAAPQKITGTIEARMTKDGRFLEYTARFQGPDMPPGEEHGVFGYDNAEKKYVRAQWSNLETQLRTFSGTLDPATKQISLDHEFSVGAGEKLRMKEITRIETPDRVLIDLFIVAKDGKESKFAETVLTRAQTASE